MEDQSKDSQKHTRKRGIKASREKIEQLMLEKGIATQLELAKKIASQESGDESHPPKDMISRVFRGHAVDPKNIQRIALALDVEPYRLYANAAEQYRGISPSEREHEQALSEETTKKGALPRSLLLGLFFIATIALLVFLSRYLHQVNEIESDNKVVSAIQFESLPITTTISGIERLLINSGELEQEQGLLEGLRSRLGDDFFIQKSAQSEHNNTVDPWQLVDDLGVDLMINVETDQKVRFRSVMIYGYTNSQKTLLFSDVFSNDELLDEHAQRQILDVLSQSLQSLIQDSQMSPPYLPNEKAVEQLQAGLVFFDEPTQANIISLGMTHLYRAVDISPEYARAHAAICRGLLGLHIMQNDPLSLEQAEQSCNKASSLAPDASYVLSAQAFLAKEQANYDVSIETANKALALSPSLIDSYLVKSESQLQLAMQKRDVALFNAAVDAATAAIELAPEFWKSYFVLGRVYYFMGKVEEAIEATQKSVDLYPNASNLLNLATQHFCFGEPAYAKELYQEIVALPYIQPIAYYNLSSVLGFFEQYEQASQAIDTYLSLLEAENSAAPLTGIIGAADTYRLAEYKEKAETYYLQAFNEAERILILDPENNEVQLQLLYIEMALTHLRQGDFEDQQEQSFLTRLDALSAKVTSSNEILLLVFANLMLEREQQTFENYQKIAPFCKGFADIPGLKKYKEMLQQKQK